MSREPMKPRVALVLLNWNGGEFTIPCIESVKGGTRQPDWLIVHDNGSTDGSPERISNAFPDVVISRSASNLGFAGGCNAGIAEAMALGADHVWLLNNDTRVAAECLDRLLAAAGADDRAAAVTGKIYFRADPQAVWYGGADFSSLRFQPLHKGGKPDDGRFDLQGEVPFISGCCMLMRSKALREIGVFRDYFFAYCEDFDWSLRSRRQGWKLLYEPSAVLWHDVSATIRKETITSSGGTASPMAHFLVTRNHALVIRLHAAGWRKALALALLAASRVGPALAMIMLRRWDKVAALWRGIYEGFTTPLAKVK